MKNMNNGIEIIIDKVDRLQFTMQAYKLAEDPKILLKALDLAYEISNDLLYETIN